MENKDELLRKLKDNNPESVEAVLAEIKENGDNTMVDPLLDALEVQTEPHLVSKIVSLLADIRESSFRDILIYRIRQAQDPQIKGTLLRIAWESALDYSSYLDLFVDILQHDNFIPAFEASTLIENMVPNLSEEQHQQLHHLYEPGVLSEDKKFLIENIMEAMHPEA